MRFKEIAEQAKRIAKEKQDLLKSDKEKKRKEDKQPVVETSQQHDQNPVGQVQTSVQPTVTKINKIKEIQTG